MNCVSAFHIFQVEYQLNPLHISFLLCGAIVQLGPGRLNVGDSRSHNLSPPHTHTLYTLTQPPPPPTHKQKDSPEPVISSSDRPLPTQQTNISMYIAGLEPAIPEFQRLHSALLRADRTATSITINTACERCLRRRYFHVHVLRN